MLTASHNARQNMFGGMPGYVRKLRKPPVVQDEGMPGLPGQAPAQLSADFDSLMGQLKATTPRPAGGLMAQAQPQPKPSPVQGLLSQKFEKPGMTWADKLGMLGGTLMDYDGTLGSGNADRARGMYDQRVQEQERDFMLQQLGAMPGVTDQQRALLGMGIGADQLAERAFAPPSEAKDPFVINDRVVDRTDPTRVIADYRDPAKTEYVYENVGEDVVAINKNDPKDRVVVGKAPVKSPLVSVNTGDEKGENKFQEGRGTQAATNFQTIVDQGRAAGASIGNLDTMESLLDQIDYTGFGGDTLLNVQRAGAMIGIEIPDLPAKEAAKRLSSQMALSLKADLPGPMSNADREFLLSIPPNLNSTAAGNDAILFILRKREERKQDMMQSLLQADPKSMEEYWAWENQYLQSTPPMFTPKTQASLLKALGGASGEDSPQ
ncbi:hypothetical protein UFOVP399_33 [uncultured Caudovirales phage]|uniref:Uncharacterized protein n=1 Tax=uncultured Caudovirales phage TaxID=2100421 RepID=A0A6J5M2G4_9CAUD|nr:hypothetical protein UFOVP399_33 [uncultured Caudovirales phage]